MIDHRGEFRKFFESRTGLAAASLMALASLGALWNTVQTEPGNFSDLGARFKIVRNIDPDGINRLSVTRNDLSPLSPFDNDLVALERTVMQECGELSKFSGIPDDNGNVPVNFRLYSPPYDYSYLNGN